MKPIIILLIVFFLLAAGLAVYFHGSSFGNKEPVPEPSVLQKEMRSVALYYYNSEIDKDASGNIMCSRRGLVEVWRDIPTTETPIEDAIRLLIRGELTDNERQAGLATEFPLPGLVLTGTKRAGGILTLEFNDPQNKTSGGACRAGGFCLQIEATAKQFPGVEQVKFFPDTIFQP